MGHSIKFGFRRFHSLHKVIQIEQRSNHTEFLWQTHEWIYPCGKVHISYKFRGSSSVWGISKSELCQKSINFTVSNNRTESSSHKAEKVKKKQGSEIMLIGSLTCYHFLLSQVSDKTFECGWNVISWFWMSYTEITFPHLPTYRYALPLKTLSLDVSTI